MEATPSQPAGPTLPSESEPVETSEPVEMEVEAGRPSSPTSRVNDQPADMPATIRGIAGGGGKFIIGKDSSGKEYIEPILVECVAEGGDDVNVLEDMHDAGDDLHDGEDADLEPHEGMEFDNYEEAFSFYKAYARREGFGVAKRSSRRSMIDDKLIDIKIVCSRYGKKQERFEAKYPRASTKTECKASMFVKKRKDDGKWFAYHFVKDHNHELLKGKAHLFRSHRRTYTPCGNKTKALCALGVPKCEIYAATSKRSCTHQNFGYPEKEIRDELDIEEYLALEAGDAQAMHEFFMHMQEENPNFFYALDLNDEQCLRSVFWVDAKGRPDYICFGDVVLFDTKYVTKMYKMPFAPFIGVNHHGQLTLLGCALVANGTTSTFVWLMKTWLRAMGGLAPKVIITEHDKAMKAAIAQVFPDSQHHLCLWHITEKIPDKLEHVTKHHKDFMESFNKCIYMSRTDEEFERQWWSMISEFELIDDDWFQSLYEDRRHWAPTYMRNICLAGMCTSQRSESVISFFDKYISRKTTLREFLARYEVARHDLSEKEIAADLLSCHTRPALMSPSPYEFQMSSVYTREIFNKFQVEVMGTCACYATKEREDGEVATFKVNDLEQNQEYVVAWDRSKSSISCLCHSFEFKGFLCRHAIVVLQFSGVPKIPSKYILKRWRKDAKNNLASSQRPNAVQSRSQRFDALCRQAIRLSQEGSLSEECYNVAFSLLERGVEQCVAMNNSHSGDTNPR